MAAAGGGEAAHRLRGGIPAALRAGSAEASRVAATPKKMPKAIVTGETLTTVTGISSSLT